MVGYCSKLLGCLYLSILDIAAFRTIEELADLSVLICGKSLRLHVVLQQMLELRLGSTFLLHIWQGLEPQDLFEEKPLQVIVL